MLASSVDYLAKVTTAKEMGLGCGRFPSSSTVPARDTPGRSAAGARTWRHHMYLSSHAGAGYYDSSTTRQPLIRRLDEPKLCMHMSLIQLPIQQSIDTGTRCPAHFDLSQVQTVPQTIVIARCYHRLQGHHWAQQPLSCRLAHSQKLFSAPRA